MNRRKKIDRNAYEPAYMQLVKIMSEQITDGFLKPGDQLPAESKICSQFQVSPMTVRRAVNILIEKGIVRTVQGKGTFVRQLNIGEAVFRLRELKEGWSQDRNTSVRLLEAGILLCDGNISRILHIEDGKHVIHIKRLVLHEGIPAMYHREYVIYDPKRPLVEAQLQITSLEGLLQGAASEGLRRGDLAIEPVNLSTEEARFLDVSPGTAAFRLEHTFYDFQDCPVSHGWFICRADRFNLTTSIGFSVDAQDGFHG